MTATPVSDRIRRKCTLAEGSGVTRAIRLAEEALVLLADAERMKGDYYGPRQIAYKLTEALRKAERAELCALGGK